MSISAVSGNIDRFAEPFEMKLHVQLVSPARVSVIRVTAGSVIVDFLILPDESGNGISQAEVHDAKPTAGCW